VLARRLGNKVELISGGYGVMGRASARLFAQEGATVFIAGRNHEWGEALAKELNDAGGKAFFVELEVTNQELGRRHQDGQEGGQRCTS
jgi:NAD(P)-dependent dehydrogenase (short-subunit alcohol dehydrogenase family)